MAGHRSHGSGETAGKLSGTTGCTDGGNLVFLFVCIPGFHAVLRGGFFAGILCFQSNRSIQAKEEKAESGIGPGTEQVEMTAENKTNTKKIVLTAVLVCAAGGIGSFLLHREAAAQRIFHGYLYGVLPLLLILPVFCGGRKQNRSESEAMAEMKHSRRQRNF